MSTRQATPGPSNVAALSTISMNPRKRGISQSDALPDSTRNTKKSKGEDSRDKKKRRKRKRKISVTAAPALSLSQSRSMSKSRTMTAEPTTPIIDQSQPNPVVPPLIATDMEDEGETAQLLKEDRLSDASSFKLDKGKGKAKEESISAEGNLDTQEAEIGRLRKELEAQKLLLEQHQSHFSQLQQSLSCEICLDLMHRPFALAPCGHVACHTCLVSWFTRDDERTLGLDVPPHRRIYVNQRKNCPICRARIVQRPVEIWGLKSMVNTFERSGFAEPPSLPFSIPDVSTTGTNNGVLPDAVGQNNDPWHNIFHPHRYGRERGYGQQIPPVPHAGEAGIEDMGMLDLEDGGIYRCLDCMHEIEGNECSSCGRIYPGHMGIDEEDDDDDDSELDDYGPRGRRGYHPFLRDLLDAVANGDLDEDEDNDIEFLQTDYDSEDGGGEDDGEGSEYEAGAALAFGEIDEEDIAGVPLGSGSLHWLGEGSELDGEPSAYLEEVSHEGTDEEGDDNDGDGVEVESSDESDESSIYAHTASLRSRPQPEMIMLNSDEDDEEDEVQFMGLARRAGRRYGAVQRAPYNPAGRAAVIITSDEEDDLE